MNWQDFLRKPIYPVGSKPQQSGWETAVGGIGHFWVFAGKTGPDTYAYKMELDTPPMKEMVIRVDPTRR